MELMRFFWDAAAEIDPEAAKLDEGVRFPLCRPEALEQLFIDAGLEGVEVRPIDIPTPFTDSRITGSPSSEARGRLQPMRCPSMKPRERACGTVYSRASRSRPTDRSR
jgi:hypothetical protein